MLRLLGRSNIGESMLMLENIDCGFMLAPEYDQSGAKFMGIQRIKMRYRATNRESIYQPYVPGNAIKLVEDYASAVPVFRNSMRPDAEDNTLFNSGIKKTITRTNTIRDLDTNMMIREDDKEHNFFNSANIINISSVKEMAPNSVLITPIIFDNIAM